MQRFYTLSISYWVEGSILLMDEREALAVQVPESDRVVTGARDKRSLR